MAAWRYQISLLVLKIFLNTRREISYLRLPCEQWFLKAGRYASMGKKPLRATEGKKESNENFNKTIV